MKIYTILTFLAALISAEIQSISSTLEGPIQEHKHEYSSEQKFNDFKWGLISKFSKSHFSSLNVQFWEVHFEWQKWWIRWSLGLWRIQLINDFSDFRKLASYNFCGFSNLDFKNPLKILGIQSIYSLSKNFFLW